MTFVYNIKNPNTIGAGVFCRTTAKEVRKLLMTESLDVGAGLLKLLLLIDNLCHSLRGVTIPAPTHSALGVRAGLLRI